MTNQIKSGGEHDPDCFHSGGDDGAWPCICSPTPAKAGEDRVRIDIGELVAAIRVNLYRHVPNMPSYPVGIVEKVLKAALSSIEEPKG